VNVLAFDTATEVLALAVSRGDNWACISIRRGLQHSPALLPVAEALLGQLGMTAADLELVVCSLGPGSFTGIRIGLSTALGIGQGRGIPVVGVSTLDASALPWEAHDGDVFPVIDARKGKIYAARYFQGVRRGDYLDISPAELAAMIATARAPLLAGPDARRIRDLLGETCAGVAVAETVDPRALVRLGLEKLRSEGSDNAALRPLYLRASEAERATGR